MVETLRSVCYIYSPNQINMYKVIIADSEANLIEMSKTDSEEIAYSQAVALQCQGFISAVVFPDGSINNVEA